MATEIAIIITEDITGLIPDLLFMRLSKKEKEGDVKVVLPV